MAAPDARVCTMEAFVSPLPVFSATRWRLVLAIARVRTMEASVSPLPVFSATRRRLMLAIARVRTMEASVSPFSVFSDDRCCLQANNLECGRKPSFFLLCVVFTSPVAILY
jgi:hypothetical protein